MWGNKRFHFQSERHSVSMNMSKIRYGPLRHGDKARRFVSSLFCSCSLSSLPLPMVMASASNCICDVWSSGSCCKIASHEARSPCRCGLQRLLMTALKCSFKPAASDRCKNLWNWKSNYLIAKIEMNWRFWIQGVMVWKPIFLRRDRCAVIVSGISTSSIASRFWLISRSL